MENNTVTTEPKKTKFKSADKKSKTLQLIATNVTKRAKVRNNSENKPDILKMECPHRRFNKKGRGVSYVSPVEFSEGELTCKCNLCGMKFIVPFNAVGDRDKIISDMNTLMRRCRYDGVIAGDTKKTSADISKVASIYKDNLYVTSNIKRIKIAESGDVVIDKIAPTGEKPYNINMHISRKTYELIHHHVHMFYFNNTKHGFDKSAECVKGVLMLLGISVEE